MTDQLFQTRLKPKMAAWVQAQADAEGESAASYIRRLVYRAANRAVLHAWICPRGANALAVHDADKPRDLDLELVVRGVEEMVCVVRLPEDKRPASEVWFRGSVLFREPAAHCLVVKGSPYVHYILSSTWASASPGVELTVSLGQQQRLDASSLPADTCPHTNAAPDDEKPHIAHCPDCRATMMTADLSVKSRRKRNQQQRLSK